MPGSEPRGPIVYVVQEPKYRRADGSMAVANTLPALAFGSLELLLPPEAQFSSLNGPRLVQELALKLAQYRLIDFILAAGDPVAIGVACALASQATRGQFTVLKWDRQEHRYYPVAVDLRGTT